MNKEQAQILSDVLAKMIVKQQQVLDYLTPSWQKTLAAYTPLIAALVAGSASVAVAYFSFKWNRNKEKQAKFNEILTNIYGEYMACSTDYINTYNDINETRLKILFNKLCDKYENKNFKAKLGIGIAVVEVENLDKKFSNLEKEFIISYKKLFTSISKIDFHLPDSKILDLFDPAGKSISYITFTKQLEETDITGITSKVDLSEIISLQDAFINKKVKEVTKALDKIGELMKTKKQ